MPNTCGEIVNNKCIQCSVPCGILSTTNQLAVDQPSSSLYKSQVIPRSPLGFTQYLYTQIFERLEVLFVQFYPFSTAPIINSTKGI